MDIAGFNLSLAGLEVLRQVEIEGERYRRGIIPNKSTVLRVARELEDAAVAFFPFKMIGETFKPVSAPGAKDNEGIENVDDDEVGEGCEFDVIIVTQTLFAPFGLADEAKVRPVDLGLASDEAKLTNNISHVAAGLKFNDVAMREPFTKLPLLLHGSDSFVQSRHLYFPLRIVIAKDNKKTLMDFVFFMMHSAQVRFQEECNLNSLTSPSQETRSSNGGLLRLVVPRKLRSILIHLLLLLINASLATGCINMHNLCTHCCPPEQSTEGF